MAPDNHVLTEAHHIPAWAKVSPFVAMVIGFVVAWWFYIVNPALPKRLAEAQPLLYRLLLNKYYFDEAYDFVFVRGANALGRFLWKRGDGAVIDGIIDGVSMRLVPWVTRQAIRLQSGYVYTYAFVMVIGIVTLITIMAITGGAN